MAGKKIVSQTTNMIDWRVDRNSYEKALRSIKKIKEAWEGIGKSFNQSNPFNKAAKSLQMSSMQVQRSFNKAGRLQREQIKKTTDFAVQQQKRMSGMIGNPSKAHDPNVVARQNNQMKGGVNQTTPPSPTRKPRVTPAAAAAATARRRADVMGNQDIRLRAKYGNSYASKLGGGLSGVRALNAEFEQGAMSVAKYRASIGALETKYRRAANSSKSLGGAVKDLRSTFVQATAAYTVFAAGKGVMQTGQTFQGINAGLAMTSDGATDAQGKLKFLKDESMRLGLDLKSASQAYMKLSVSSKGKINSDQTNKLFTGVSELSTAMGLDSDSQSGAIYALQQMLSKGKVQSEELNGQ